MRQLTLTLTEFINFRHFAKCFEILFDHTAEEDTIQVQAKEEDLQEMGF